MSIHHDNTHTKK